MTPFTTIVPSRAPAALHAIGWHLDTGDGQIVAWEEQSGQVEFTSFDGGADYLSARVCVRSVDLRQVVTTIELA